MDEENEGKVSSVKGGLIQLASLLVVLLTLTYIVRIVLNTYSSATDAAAVLGVIVPVFATVGAAVFGIQVAYGKGEQAGQKKGEELGRIKGRKETAKRLLGLSETSEGARDPVFLRSEIERILAENE